MELKRFRENDINSTMFALEKLRQTLAQNNIRIEGLDFQVETFPAHYKMSPEDMSSEERPAGNAFLIQVYVPLSPEELASCARNDS